MIADILGIIASLMFLTDYYWLCVFGGRFLCGIVLGLNSTVVPMYIKEMSPVSISGMLGSFN
jgi:hypothetical protein